MNLLSPFNHYSNFCNLYRKVENANIWEIWIDIPEELFKICNFNLVALKLLTNSKEMALNFFLYYTILRYMKNFLKQNKTLWSFIQRLCSIHIQRYIHCDLHPASLWIQDLMYILKTRDSYMFLNADQEMKNEEFQLSELSSDETIHPEASLISKPLPPLQNLTALQIILLQV
ncbi:hypothetical protein Glove_58g41 [Diversispora epigaea]|uniref:Protein kinase domain-containing protein n=1 Tax=Diversispora epigaea TaxID=1348612 RepID=A0A397JCZ1_9GLOM|nr:hypothetical protein Glove_58g41 [Diversispora epigaea]